MRQDCSLWRNRRPNVGVERVVERLLARVPERRVTRVVSETDRLDEVLVETESPRHDA